jgi:pimeloyl-ACP methyl ester carboxylesterase
MKTTFLRQTTDDKLILQGLLHEPDASTKNLILHIHGMSGNFYENRFLDSMASTFTDNAWAFLTPNTRGHDFIAELPIAGSGEEFRRVGNTFEKFEECVFDIKCWMDFAEQKGYTNIILQGHSLGCAKVVFYLYKTKDKRVKKLILASLADMVGFGLRGDKDGKMVALAKKLIKEGRGDEILPELYDNWAYISASTMVDFTSKNAPIDVFNIYDPKARSIALESVAIPALAFMGSGKDSYMTNTAEETLEITKTKAKNCPEFDTFIVEGAPHSYFAHEQEVAELIINWVK